MEKSLDWNEKCPSDEIESKNHWESRKFSVIFKIKKKNEKLGSPYFLLCFCMVIEEFWKKNWAMKLQFLVFFLGNSKNLINILKTSKIHQKSWKVYVIFKIILKQSKIFFLEKSSTTLFITIVKV
jgi:hypothetical protein